MVIKNILNQPYLDKLIITEDVKTKRDNMANYIHHYLPNFPYPSLQGIILLALIIVL